jgi:hypothetical protein
MRISNLFVSLLCTAVLLFSTNSFAEQVTTTTSTTTAADGTTTVVKKTITTPAPKSVNCTTVPAHWDDAVWVDVQTVCKYEGRSEGAEWVQDYWACTAFTDSGDCTKWESMPGYWIKS